MSSHTDTRQPDPKRRMRLAAGLLGATCLAAAGVAYGQAGGLPYDPSQLPETKGAIKQYTLTPRGDVDGLILADGTEVKVPPHLTAQVVFAVRPGDAVTIRGLKARALPLISAATIRNDATGATVTDEGGPRGERDRPESLITAKVASLLHGPRGEVNGVLLENGTVLRMPPSEAARWEKLIQPGQTLSARGVVTATLLGSVMEARAIGANADQLTYLALPKPPKPPKHEREAREERGPGPREAREDKGPRGPREARDEKGPKGSRDDRGPSRTAASDVFAPPPPPPGGPAFAPPPGGPGGAPPPPPGAGNPPPPAARP